MSLNKSFKRMRQTDSLIRKKAARNAASLAKKLSLSRAGVYKWIEEMKEAGFPIAYCKKEKTYIYTEEGKMVGELFEKDITKEHMRKITGGGKDFARFFQTIIIVDKPMIILHCKHSYFNYGRKFPYQPYQCSGLLY